MGTMFASMWQLLLNKLHNGCLTALFWKYLMRNSSEENWSVILGPMEKNIELFLISLWKKFVAYL